MRCPMKCPGCSNLAAPTDTHCIRCGTPLRGGRSGYTPGWAYLFAGACGLIPIVALGGMIPIAIGLGGAGSCVSVARLSTVPVLVGVLLCLLITGGCGAGFAILIAAVMAATSSR